MLKIALIQCQSVAGDIVGNTARILAQVSNLPQDCFAVLPGAALCGLYPASYLNLDEFAVGVFRALNVLAKTFANGPILLLSCPQILLQATQKQCADAVILIEKGQWRILQNNDCLYFLSVQGWSLAIVAGEFSARDIASLDPSMDILIKIAPLPWHLGVQTKLENELAQMAQRLHIFILTVNLVGGNDGQICHGQSVLFDPRGQLCTRAKAFEEDLLLLNLECTNYPLPAPVFACREEELWRGLIRGMRDFVQQCHKQLVVLGLSGGLDSALVCCLAVEAFSAQQVLAVMMPSPYTSTASLEDANALAQNLGVTLLNLQISELMRSFDLTLQPIYQRFPADVNDLTPENLQARIRGVLLNAIANRSNALILNTSNKSEIAMGYSTLYGDTVGALAVIGDLTKTQVYALARWYNKIKGQHIIPQNILDKAPSAELRPNQKDSDSLPEYAQLDPALENILQAEIGNNSELAQKICSQMLKTEFKRRQMPPALITSPIPFGQVWRTPVTGEYRPL